MECSNCGYMLSPFDVTCPRCERLKLQAPKQPAPTAPVAPTEPTESTVNFACVACGSENVQKISAIYKGGTWSANTSGSSISAAFVGNGNVVPILGSTVSMTSGNSSLARLLAPPDGPRRPDLIASVYLAFLAALIICCFGYMYYCAGAGLLIPAAVFIVAEALIGVRISKTHRDLQAFPNLLAQWEQAMHHWNQLFYCSRCDHVYNPQTK